jgi:hypothetical protein
MPCTIAHIEFFLYKPENVEDLSQDVSGRPKGGVRKKLVVQIADTDGAIYAQTVKTKAIRKEVEACPKLRHGEAVRLPLWQRWWKPWRRKMLARKKLRADKCLFDVVTEELKGAMRSKRDIAIGPHPPAPLRLVRPDERFEVLELSRSACGVRVWICESESLLADHGKVLACVA